MALHDLELNSSMRFAKFMLVLVSFMFALTAVLLVMVGGTIQAIMDGFSVFLDAKFHSPPTLLIIIGFLLLGVAALGAYGACKESVLLINLYGVALFIVFLMELCAAIAAFALQGHIHAMLERTMQDAMKSYENNTIVANGVDYMQYSLQCCGVTGPDDWRFYENSGEDDSHLPPFSCCNDDKCSELGVYKNGCLTQMEYIVEQSTMLITTGASTVAFVQLLGVICAFMLAKTLRRNKSLREVRRWQMQQSLGILTTIEKPLAEKPCANGGYQQLEKSAADLCNKAGLA